MVTHSAEELVKLVNEPERWSFLKSSGQKTPAHERPGQPDAQDGSHLPMSPCGHKVKTSEAPPIVMTSERDTENETEELGCELCGLECDSESELDNHMIRIHSAEDLVELVNTEQMIEEEGSQYLSEHDI